MICIRKTGYKDGCLSWTAEDESGEIGQIAARAGDIPEITQLKFEQPEIGDGLIKTAAAFFAETGIRRMRFAVHSGKAEAAALAAGFSKTEKGLEIDPGHVKRSCGGH